MAKKITPEISKPQSLRVLVVEDSEDDALFIIRELKKGGYNPMYERVETAAAMKKALQEKQWDIILCDYSLPKFNALSAIALLKETNIDIPLIIVSGTIGEDVGIECMRLGAHDYIIKGSLSRLCPAVARELEESEVKEKQRQAESQREEALEELEESEERYRSIYDNSPISIELYDAEGALIHVNRSCQDLFGVVDVQDIRGLSLFANPNISDEHKVKLRRGEAIHYQGLYDFEKIKTANIYRTSRTGIIWLDEHIKPLRNGTELITGFLIQIQDITERKHDEEALRLSEENFRRSLEDLPLGARIVTIEGETVYANQAILNIYGYDSIEELKTTPVENRYTPESFAEYRIRKEKRKRGDNDPSEYDIDILRKDGEVRHLHVFRKDILWNGERQFQVLYNDITDRKRAEAQLHTSLREKEILLREVHHRVKNNMQVISGLLDLPAALSGNPERRKMFHDSQSRIHAMSLVHEKLYGSNDFARIDLAVYVKTLSQDLFQTYKINPGKIDLIIQTDGDVYVDINKAIPCGLILNELISNAIKHAFPGDRHGELQIIIRGMKNTEIEIVVRDNGSGMPDDVDIHQPLSVGLYLVKGLVKSQLDGKMEVRRDVGTEIRIKFPLYFEGGV